MKSADPITLEHEGWYLQVSKMGGCVLSCRYEGQDILRPAQDASDPVLTSCFPLVPFSNRIAKGQFSFDGHDIKLPLTRSGEPHPIHGYGWISEWGVSRHLKDILELSFDYTDTDWPWAFRCTQSFFIKDNALTLSLKIENTGTFLMPAGLGFHSYFPGVDTAMLKFGTDGYWKSDDENLPTIWQAVGNHEALKIIDQDYDNCFTGWDKFAEISWPDQSYKVEIKGSDLFDFAVLYTPNDEDHFCFEPVSHMNNAVNFEQQSGHTGLQTLRPEKTMDVSMTLRAVPK